MLMLVYVVLQCVYSFSVSVVVALVLYRSLPTNCEIDNRHSQSASTGIRL
jgi:hypothetical protein